MSENTRRLGWLITGASQGFGRALATEVLSRGEAVVAAVRDEKSVRELRERYPDRLSVAVADLREPGAVEAVAEAARERFGVPDVLVKRISAAYTRDLAAVQRWADLARSADYPDAAPSVRPV